MSRDGEGLTKTGGITKGAGVIYSNNDVEGTEPDDGNQENQDTLKVVLRNKGLAGVFDHNFMGK